MEKSRKLILRDLFKNIDKLIELSIKSNVFSFLNSVYRSILDNNCLLRAAALTYVTTLSIVPFLAIVFSISKGLGFHHTEFIHDFLLKVTANREDVVKNILTYINNTNAGKVGTLGVVALLGVVLSLLGTIEDTLNSIFEIEKNRTLKEKITSYFSMTLLSPILLIVLVTFSSSLSNITFIKKLLSYSFISHIYILLLKIVPFFVVWISIFLIFCYLPNGKIDLKSIAIGSFFSSLLWQIARHIFVTYHPFDYKYNAIYGGFAKVLLLLLWLYFSWIMLLIGAVIAHEFKSIRFGCFNYKQKLGNFNIALKEGVFLHVMLYMINMFKKGDGVVSVEELSQEINLPPFIIQDFLKVLKQLGFIVEVKEEDRKLFLIASNIFDCTLEYFIKQVRNFNDLAIDPRINFVIKNFSMDMYIKNKEKTLSELSYNLVTSDFLQNVSYVRGTCNPLNPRKQIDIKEWNK